MINKLAPIVEHNLLGPILCAKDSLFDADTIIKEKKIVIVNLFTGSHSDHIPRILGEFVVNKIMAAAWRQGNIDERKRIRHFLFVDEFQNFMHRGSEYDSILSAARKYNLVLIVANQFISQLQEKVRDAIFGNVGCLVIFRIAPKDAATLKDEFDGISKRDLLDLKRGECFIRFSTPFHTQSLPVRTPPPPPKPEHDPSKQIIERMHNLIADLRGEDTQEAAAAGDEPADAPPTAVAEKDEDDAPVVLCEFA